MANSFISFLAGFIVFLGFWLWQRPLPSLSGLGYFLVLILLLSGLILSLNFFTGIIYTKLKDFLSVWEVLLQLLFWGTPIVYPLSILPEPLQRLALLNPLAVIVSQSRVALISGSTDNCRLTAQVIVITAILLFFGYKFFSNQIKKIAENF